MTKKIKKFAILFMAITIGVTVFTSCNEEDSTDTLKEEQDATFEKKKKVEIDERVTDKEGNTWHIKGTLEIKITLGVPPIKVVHWDVTLTNETTNKTYHFKGITKHRDDVVAHIEGSLFNEKLEKEGLTAISDLSYILNLCVNNVNNKN